MGSSACREFPTNNPTYIIVNCSRWPLIIHATHKTNQYYSGVVVKAEMPLFIGGILAFVAAFWSSRATPETGAAASLASQAVLIDPLDFNVLSQNGAFRDSSFTEFFNPTNSTPPFFQVFHPDFLSILGKKPSIRAIAANPEFAFAHEAPIWLPGTDEVFFASNDGGPLGMSDIDHNNQVSKVSLKDVSAAIARVSGHADVNVTVTKLDLPDTVQMTNGGTGPFRSSLLLINSGRGPLPPSLTLVNPKPPFNTTLLLDNFFGRQFNSLNDVKIHPKMYRFDPDTGRVRVVADGFDRPNGIAFTKDGNTAYIADTGATAGFLGNNQTEPATIYAFDVDPKTQAFLNRRVFAYVDTGVADGVQLDSNGNVYAGCGDGTQVWNPEGELLGKFFIGNTSANMIFAGKGRLVIMGETKIFFAEIAAEGFDLSFP
ncbi:unnamed protein product [Somion occarium]|uniref:SMP-30/Gluconolactonase/LRE-like region domain-containing protein n=1 Tax=Somion occarium TaxID=3059160 RepID=A0ABP1DRK7_9APHY